VQIRLLLLMTLTAGAVPPLAAQAVPASRQDAQKGVEFKNLAPVSNEVLRVRLPRASQAKLKNGLPVFLIESHRVPIIALEVTVYASTVNDPPGLAGVTECVGAMLKLGAGGRGAADIADVLRENGAVLAVNVEYGSQTTRIMANMLSRNFDNVVAVLADMLAAPAFSQEELDRWKAVQTARLQSQRSSEFFLGNERLHQVLYGQDPRRIVSLSAESLRAIAREDLLRYHQKYYRPGNSVLGVAGDVPPDAAARLDRALARWTGDAATDASLLPLAGPIADKRVYLVDRPNSVQTYLSFANLAIPRNHPDYVACQVLNQILGAGPSSRLFRNLRGDKGLTYGVSSSFVAQNLLHHFSTAVSVRPEAVERAIREVLAEFESLRTTPVPLAELDRAKRAIVAGFALQLESQANVLRQALSLREYGLAEDYWDKYPSKVMSITSEDVQAAARRYLPVENVQLIAVGDARKIGPALGEYGPVERYSADGSKESADGPQHR
jgi:predicted Zn-dependent peptidase